MARVLPRGAVAALASLALAGAPASWAAAGESPPPGAEQMRIENGSFKPAMISARAGDSVTWPNRDAVPHRIVATKEAPARLDSGRIAPGSSATYVIPAGGTYDIFCSLHKDEIGMLMVSNADGSYPAPAREPGSPSTVERLLAPVTPR